MVSAHLETQPVCVWVSSSLGLKAGICHQLSITEHSLLTVSVLRQWWQTLISYLSLSALCDVPTEHNRHFSIQALNSLFWIVASISQYKLLKCIIYIYSFIDELIGMWTESQLRSAPTFKAYQARLLSLPGNWRVANRGTNGRKKGGY